MPRLPIKYTGKTGSIFHTKCKEHLQAIRNKNSNSACSSHILNMQHTYETIKDTMDIIGTHKKENLITLEKYHIYIIGEMTYT
jgi:hypothetical protein